MNIQEKIYFPVFQKFSPKTEVLKTASLVILASSIILAVAGMLYKLYPFFFTKTFTKAEELIQFLEEDPKRINTKINFNKIRYVWASHLLCSGKLSPEDLEKTKGLLKKTIPFMDLSLIDKSNLWIQDAQFIGQGSGNNILKSAVASASASTSGIPERRVLVEILFEELEKSPLSFRQEILDARDNFRFGRHTTAEFLTLQGNEDLALKALQMGATITPDLLLYSCASAGSTIYGTKLVEEILNRLQGTPLEEETYWKAAACLAAHTQENVEGLSFLIEILGEKNCTYWKSTRFNECVYSNKSSHKRWSITPFGKFTDFYRKDGNFVFETRNSFLNTDEGKEAFARLYTLFSNISKKS